MHPRGKVVVAAALAAALAVPVATRAAAQTTGGGPTPSGAHPAAVLDYVGTVFNPAGGSFDFDVDARDLSKKGVDRTRVDNVHFSGRYSATPCPDTHGTAKTSVSVTVKLTGGALGLQESYQAELPIEVDVNDKAETENVRFAGRYFDKARNRRGNLEDSVTRLQYDRALEQSEAVVDNEGPFEKADLQKKGDLVEQHARALAGRVAQALQAIWQDGKTCVSLAATPGSKSVKPKERLQIDVTATAKDGAVPKRPITAVLDGPTSIKPKASKRAPGTFKYVAGAKRGDTGHVTFEQRSNRGIGRAEAEYRVGDKLKFDVSAMKVPMAGGEHHLPCDDVRCGSGASVTGLSVTIELGDDGRGVGQGTATLHVSTATLVQADCTADSTVPVNMVVSVETVGDTLKVSARSNPDPTYQWCGGFAHNGPESVTQTILFPSVTVPKDGGSGSTTSGADQCLVTGTDAGHYGCTYTVTATKVTD